MPSQLAKQFLTDLQQGRHKTTGGSLPIVDPTLRRASYKTFLDENRLDLTPAQKRRQLAGYLRHVAAQAAAVPSKYEDPVVYDDLTEIGKAVDTATRTCGYPDLRDQILLGTLDSGRLTATTYYLAGTDEYILTVNLGLWTVARQLAWTVTQAIKDVVRGDFLDDSNVGAAIRMRLVLEPSIQAHFYRILSEWAIEGRAHPHATVYEEVDKAFGISLHRSLKAFTVAHEYGHIVLGHHHFEKLAADVPLVAMIGPTVKERMADEVALRVLQQLEDAEHLTARPWAGAAAYFVSTEIFSRVIGIMKYGDEDVEELSNTHPQPALRWSDLRKKMIVFDRAAREAMTVEVALRLLWEHARPAILQLRAEGIRVARVWQSEARTGGRVTA